MPADGDQPSPRAGGVTASASAAALPEAAAANASQAAHGAVRTIVAESLAKDGATPERYFSLPKLMLYAVQLLIFWTWWDLFGIWLTPLYIYVGYLHLPGGFTRGTIAARMEVRSIVIIYTVLLSIPVVLFWITWRGGLFSRTGLAGYLAWSLFVDDAPTRGGRFLSTLRRRSFWRHFASYFPMKLTRTAELDPKRHYIFGYHPHGIISVGALCNFGTEALGFSQLFPGIDLRLLTLAMNFKVPIFREYLLGMGINDVSRNSCKRNLSRCPGSSIMIVVGGARESIETKPGGTALVLEHRKGFVKLALQQGASLVPVYSFGENDVYGVYQTEKLKKFQVRMQKRLGFAVPLFFGRALTGGVLQRIFGLDTGLMPLRVPVHSVVGRPVHLEKVENPTNEEIDSAHALYIEELKRVYDDWKGFHDEEREAAVAECSEERKKLLKDSRFRIEENLALHMVD
eukprot:TRINITY_DN5355_c1_g1_i1.p1 TRINITY_DN5355_c1_g1~~TRINITY_DN5355_c1_g1_i1.p1  ORF type:complete len:458 (-),score=73.45 TRINITY_DN5355_c1_g1_i1:38-1411(-)